MLVAGVGFTGREGGKGEERREGLACERRGGIAYGMGTICDVRDEFAMRGGVTYVTL